MPSYNMGMNDSFLQCISALCGMELSSARKYGVFDERTAVAEGHGGVVGYTQSSVRLCWGSGVLEIRGSGLCLKCIDGKCAVVTGKIKSVEICDV